MKKLLCLLLFCLGLFVPSAWAEEIITINFEEVTKEEYAAKAQNNFYTLPAVSIGYNTYPLMLRFRSNLGLTQPRVEAQLISDFRDKAEIPLPNATLEWIQGSWMWEGREEEGPAPGLQFTADIPLLSPPGQYRARVQVSLFNHDTLVSSFPVELSLTIPRWVAVEHSPQVIKVRKIGLEDPGRVILESDNLRFMVAANTNWSLWLGSNWFSSAKFVANGTSTINLQSGYTNKSYRIREVWQASLDRPETDEASLEVILKY